MNFQRKKIQQKKNLIFKKIVILSEKKRILFLQVNLFLFFFLTFKRKTQKLYMINPIKTMVHNIILVNTIKERLEDALILILWGHEVMPCVGSELCIVRCTWLEKGNPIFLCLSHKSIIFSLHLTYVCCCYCVYINHKRTRRGCYLTTSIITWKCERASTN